MSCMHTRLLFLPSDYIRYSSTGRTRGDGRVLTQCHAEHVSHVDALSHELCHADTDDVLQ